MTERRFLAIMLAAIALSHIYLLYPLPSTRVEEIRRAGVQNDQVGAAVDPKRATSASKVDTQTSSTLDGLEKSLWEGWVIALSIVVLGLTTAVFVSKIRAPWWYIAALVFCIAYLSLFWIESVPPLHRINQFVEFQINTISSLIRLGHFDRLLMVAQQLLAPLGLAIIGFYVCVRAVVRRSEQ
jgi:hypothetical protein